MCVLVDKGLFQLVEVNLIWAQQSTCTKEDAFEGYRFPCALKKFDLSECEVWNADMTIM